VTVPEDIQTLRDAVLRCAWTCSDPQAFLSDTDAVITLAKDHALLEARLQAAEHALREAWSDLASYEEDSFVLAEGAPAHDGLPRGVANGIARVRQDLRAALAVVAAPSECVCGEINTRHCPVHAPTGEVNEPRSDLTPEQAEALTAFFSGEYDHLTVAEFTAKFPAGSLTSTGEIAE
jgi:hypothetical protein